MILVPKPKDRLPLYGGKTLILFGSFDKSGMRRWQQRLRSRPAGLEGCDDDDHPTEIQDDGRGT